MSLISYGKQYLDSKDIKSVNKILYSSFLTQGLQYKFLKN